MAGLAAPGVGMKGHQVLIIRGVEFRAGAIILNGTPNGQVETSVSMPSQDACPA